MKRGDMVREIKSIIATCGPTQPTIVTAEQVLSRIEAIGMLPPGYPKPIPICQDGNYYPLIPGDFKIDGVWCTPGINEWEPE
jgi:hypothetical protein